MPPAVSANSGSKMCMNMLAEQNPIFSKITAALDDMRTASAGDLETPGEVAATLRRYNHALALVVMQARDHIGIFDACVQLHRYFSGICETPRALTPGERNLLFIWPDALADCFADPVLDHSTTLSLVMVDLGILSGDAAPAQGPATAVDSASAVPEMPEPGDAAQAGKDDSPASGSDVTALDERSADATPDDVEPVTAMLGALEEISAIASEDSFSDPGRLTQDGIMRYAMTLMRLRDNAEAAGLGRLMEACDALSPVLAKLMEAQDPADRADCEALTGFALDALDMLAPVETTITEASPSALTTTADALPAIAIESDPPAPPSPDETDMPADAQQVSQDMLALLAAELAGIGDSLQAVLPATTAGAETAARMQACDECGETIERLGHAANSIGLVALSRVLDRLSRNLRAAGSTPELDLSALIPDLLGRIGAYLTHPTDLSACGGLVDVLLDAAWQAPLPREERSELADALANVVAVAESTEGEARPEYAREEDVSLALPDDLNAALLENLLLELPHQVEAFTGAIGRLTAGGGQLTDVETAKRAAHTLKGAANTVGVRGIASLTHHLEDILIAFSDRGVLPGQSLAPMLIRAGDCLETMNEALQGTGPAPDDALEVLQEILDCATRIDREGLPDEEAIETSTAVQPQPSAPAKLEELAEAVSMLRIPAPLIDELLRLVGETITTNAQTQERLRLSVKQAQAVKAQNRLLHQLVNELDGLVDIHGAASPVRHHQGDEHFDALEMEQYSELHTLKNRLVEAVTDVTEISAQSEEQLSALGEVLEVQSRLQLESQEAVMRTRMVRVETIVSRLQRGVRQASRLLDKNVTLTVKGTETLMDGGVLNELIDPLMHVLRNAVDHGIEDAETRLAHGKEASGRIELSFVREGNAIAVRCRDDGCGLDMAAIRSRAMEHGLIDGAQTLSDDDVARLILIPGFSTRDETTQVSGRGIGMDIVNKRVEDLKGSLTLHSDAGRGLDLEIRIPLSMLSTHALLVRVKERMVALSTRNIEDIHYVMPDQIRLVGIQRHYQVNDVVHDVVRLDALLNTPGDRRARERTGFPVLLVRQSNGVIRAIEVQEIVDSRNLVMKSLGVYVPAIKGVAGAAILGDGSVVPVIDLPDLLRAGMPMPHADDDEIDGHGDTVPMDADGHRTALVVDDSLSARRATAQVMKDAGYIVRTAIDGMEAVSILEKFVPDIILADMEMPRMNGLELTSHVRGKSSTRDVPVIMITSRSTDKHRKQAQAAGVSVYLTKPFSDEVLLRHVSELGLEVVS